MAEQTAAPTQTGPIVARAYSYYRLTRIGMLVLLGGFGVWFCHDGYFVWPRENRQNIAQGITPPHTTMDITLNQWLGVLLPPLGIAAMAWGMYQSRGEYRLANGVLSVPGHPLVPLSDIDSIDKARWDKKGIALIHYTLRPSGEQRVIRLDDYVYEREPTDKIFEQIEQSLLGIGDLAAIPGASASQVPPAAASSPPAGPPRPVRVPPASQANPDPPPRAAPPATPPAPPAAAGPARAPAVRPPPPPTRLPPRPKLGR